MVRMMHVGLGRANPLHIEYIHIGACLSVIQDILTEAILSHPRLHLSRKIAVVKALGKVIWIQNDLFAKWYVSDGEEFTDGVDYGEIEKEGWLHGRKVLDGEEGPESAEVERGMRSSPGKERGDRDTTPTPGGAAGREDGDGVPAGVCPFTGMSVGMKE
jgi:hypothetical protein